MQDLGGENGDVEEKPVLPQPVVPAQVNSLPLQVKPLPGCNNVDDDVEVVPSMPVEETTDEVQWRDWTTVTLAFVYAWLGLLTGPR